MILAQRGDNIWLTEPTDAYMRQWTASSLVQEMACCPKLTLNTLRAKFFRGNKNIYLHLMSFVNTDMTQVVEIFPQVRQELIYST